MKCVYVCVSVFVCVCDVSGFGFGLGLGWLWVRFGFDLRYICTCTHIPYFHTHIICMYITWHVLCTCTCNSVYRYTTCVHITHVYIFT